MSIYQREVNVYFIRMARNSSRSFVLYGFATYIVLYSHEYIHVGSSVHCNINLTQNTLENLCLYLLFAV